MIQPPATLGIIGGGQLGMMTVREAHRMGYRTAVWDPDPACSASRLADEVITGSYEDRDCANRLAKISDVLTYEFENIDARAVEYLETRKKISPASSILRVAQHRRAEKMWLREHGFPLVEFRLASSVTELHDAVAQLGFPVVSKTAASGYDGKGQHVVRNPADLSHLAASLAGDTFELVVEKCMDLAGELSVIVAREQNGRRWHFPVAANFHRENILHVSLIPAPGSPDLLRKAESLAEDIAEQLGVVGLLCVELFLTRSGSLLVNELAPRPHNSGHATIDACSMSQFEALVRTITGVPVRKPELLQPGAIVNILGKHLGTLDFSGVHRVDGVRVHLYGKGRMEPKRKMGHISIVRSSLAQLVDAINNVERLLGEQESEITVEESEVLSTS